MSNRVKSIILLGAIFLLTLLVATMFVIGCVPDEANPETDTVSLVAQYQHLKAQYEQIAYQIEAQKVIYNDTILQLQQSNDSLVAQALQYQTEYNNMVSAKDDAKKELLALKGESIALGQKVFTLTDELEKANTNLDIMHEQYEEVAKLASPLRKFTSSEELIEWLEADNTGNLTQVKDIFDCDDFALVLQRHAKESGYKIDLQYYSSGTKLPMSTRVLKTAHNMCTTIIGNWVWLIEPMTDETWGAYKLD